MRPAEAIANIRMTISQELNNSINALDSFNDIAGERWAKSSAKLVQAGEKTVAKIATVKANAELGSAVSPDIQSYTGTAMRGIDPEEVMMRPIVSARTELANGGGVEEAKRAAQVRATSISATNLQLARTKTVREVYTRSGVTAWAERVLTGSKSCALCALASTQRYYATDLLPIHSGCDCDVVLHRGVDPGHVLNKDKLEFFYKQIEDAQDGLRGGDFAQYRSIAVQTHSEHGQVLTWARHNFTGINDF